MVMAKWGWQRAAAVGLLWLAVSLLAPVTARADGQGARAGGPVVAAALTQVGIVLDIQPVAWAQWLAGTLKGAFDVPLINHVAPLDHKIYSDSAY